MEIFCHSKQVFQMRLRLIDTPVGNGMFILFQRCRQFFWLTSSRTRTSFILLMRTAIELKYKDRDQSINGINQELNIKIEK